MTAGGYAAAPRSTAITGGIGSGKSRVAQWLAAECGLPLFDADNEVRDLLQPGARGWQGLRAWLDPAFFAADGALLKARLRQAIFADAELRRRVEGELHPLVFEALRQKMAVCPGRCLVEVPLLYEVGWQGRFDEVLVVHASADICCRRVMRRDAVPAEAAMAAIRSQMAIEAKLALADYVVENGGKWCATVRQLRRIKKIWATGSR